MADGATRSSPKRTKRGHWDGSGSHTSAEVRAIGVHGVSHYIAPLRAFTHPVFKHLRITSEDTLAEPRSAVITDCVPWQCIGPANIPGDANSANKAIYRWLDIDLYPPEVHDYFKVSTARDRRTAIFHAYRRGQWVIHCVDIGARRRSVLKALEDLSLCYEAVLRKYIDALNGERVPADTKLRLPPFGMSFFAENETMLSYLALITLSAIALSLIRIPLEMLNPLLRKQSIVLCVAPNDVQLFDAVYQGKLGRLSMLSEDDAMILPLEKNSYDWIMRGTTSDNRLNRLAAFFDTLICVWNGGYRLDQGQPVRMQGIERMIAGTQIFTIDDAAKYLQENDNPQHSTTFSYLGRRAGRGDTVMEVAARRTAEGFCVVAVNAASAYHCGGGVATGGRHASEEAWCVMSTLFRSLSRASHFAHVNAPTRRTLDSSAAFTSYIPDLACILSPHVEVFRAPSAAGYSWNPSVVELAGVVTVAAYNKNPAVTDCPLDAPTDFDVYLANLVRKVLSAFAGALQLKAEVLVLVDIGCGVYQNDPAQVGEICNVVLRETRGYFKEVVVLGKSEFVKRALKGLESNARALLEAQKLDSAATNIQAHWRGRQGRISAQQLYESKEAEMTEAWREWAATKIQAGVRSYLVRQSLQSDISANNANANSSCSIMLPLARFDGTDDTRERAAPFASLDASRGNVTAHFKPDCATRHPTMTSRGTPHEAELNAVKTHPQRGMQPVREDNTVVRVKQKVPTRVGNLGTNDDFGTGSTRRVLLHDEEEIRETRHAVRRMTDSCVFLDHHQSRVVVFLRLFAMLKDREAAAVIQSCVQSRPAVLRALDHCPVRNEPLVLPMELSTGENVLHRCIHLSRQIPDAMLTGAVVFLGSTRPALVSAVRRVNRTLHPPRDSSDHNPHATPTGPTNLRVARGRHITLFRQAAEIMSASGWTAPGYHVYESDL